MMLTKFSVELELREESSDDDADDFPKLVGTTIIMPQKELILTAMTAQTAAGNSKKTQENGSNR